MTGRIALDNLTGDALDQPHARAEKAERAVDHLADRYRGAEAAIERVRRPCGLTIAASVRVQAVQQARDTLAALDEQQPTA
ncbi:hypothetical protein OOK13_07255 [Streptomyces sp. NBC_00378]|uniref:hypothetical protein n=1 Tax=unclassified Streptomyces TaxID=2593676 RepID=UPI00225BEC57|nr:MULTISPECIES: hypothetical protein [unclassified Streptomyces]MCX5108324.1 hypothetical protein [Streptomyces sp. NBC_00378]